MPVPKFIFKGAKSSSKVSEATNATKASEKNVLKPSSKATKTSKVEKLLRKGKKEFLKGLLKDKFKDWLFSPEDSAEDNLAEEVKETSQTTKVLAKRQNAKERSDKGSSHWRKDGDIEKASKYRYTIDLDKAIEQDKALQNINERLDSALYAISGNIPNFKVSKEKEEKGSSRAKSVKDENPASEQSILSLNHSISLLNETLRKSKQTVTEETAQKLLSSNAKIEVLVKRISDDMIDEQDTRIKPIENKSSTVENIAQTPERVSQTNILKKGSNSGGWLKSLLMTGLAGLTTGLINFIADNFLEDGKFSMDKVEEWFSEKWDNFKSWISDTFNIDNIIQSVKDWFTADPVAALGESFIATLAGLTGVKLTKAGIKALKTSNAKSADKKASKKEIEKAKEKNTAKKSKVSSKASIPAGVKAKGLMKGSKILPGLGAVFAVVDVINAVDAYLSGDIEGAKTHLVEAGVDALEAIPGVGTAVFLADIASTFFTGKSLSDRFNNFRSGSTTREEMHNNGIIEKAGLIGNDKIKDKQALEMLSADDISDLIQTGDWSAEDLQYLEDLYKRKENETDEDLEKRRKQVIDKIKEIGVNYHKDRDTLIELCKNNQNLANTLKDAENSNDKVGYSKVIAERFGNNTADIYRRAELALKTAFNLGYSVKLTKDEIEKLLKIGKYDKKYLDEYQEILKASEENSPEFTKALDDIISSEKMHSDDGADYDEMIRKEMMQNPNFWHEQGGARSEFDTSGKPKDTGGPVENYQGEFKTVGGDAIQISDAVTGPYAQKYPKIRGIRNNNPGNIRISNVKWEGKVPREKNTDGNFEQFCAPEFGIRALVMNAKNYQVKHNLWTPRAMIWKWAPPNENNSNKYVQDVIRIFHQSSYEKARNITADTSFTMTDPELAYCMTCGIILKECGVNPYPEGMIKRAINSALGKESLLTKSQADVIMKQSSDMMNSVAMPTSMLNDNTDDNAGPEGKSNNYGVLESSSTMPTGITGVAGDYLRTATALASSATGYSQTNRMGDSQYDCSSFVSRTLKQCGFNINPNTTTYAMRKTLTDLGFTYTPVSDIQGDYSMLQAGDILLNDRNQGDNHTEFYMGNGWTVGAHSEKNGVSARPNVIDVYHYNGFLRHNGSDVDNSTEDDIMNTTFNEPVTPIKDTTKSDQEVMQTSEGISNAVSNTPNVQPVHVSNNMTNIEQAQEQVTDDSAERLFDANVVNTDFASLEFGMSANMQLGY